MPKKKTVWKGCYEDNWKDIMCEEAFSHPAKFSRGLIRRIYECLRDEYLLPRGSTVVDPFGGVALGALDAMANGYRWVGCELEPRFFLLAQKNIKLWQRYWPDRQAVIVQGDSRRLVSVLGPVMADCVVGSPPFSVRQPTADSRPGEATELRDIKPDTYGTSPGQLGVMKPGSVAAVVSSPPFCNSVNRAGEWNESIDPQKGAYPQNRSKQYTESRKELYGTTPGQIGNEAGTTFWAAASEIVHQCHTILKPGGLAVWVTKDYVRNKKRVPFSADWVKLAEACGFRLVEWIQASLVSEYRQAGLFDDEVVEKKERKSFFRRLCEKKGSPRIDNEDVLIMVKE